MKKLASILVCLVLMCSVQSAIAANATGSLTRTTYSLGDTEKVYLTVVGPKDQTQYRQLCSLFAAQPEFSQVKDQTHFHKLETQSTMYRDRYARDYKAFPTVRVQTADGNIVKEWAGQNIPASQELLDELRAECLRRKRPQPKPKPQPQPDSQPSPDVDIRPRPVAPGRMPLWVFGGAMLTGVLAAAWHELSRETR